MTNGFNLDVILGESEDKPLTYKGKEFTLPGELPADCLAPFLADDLGLLELVADAVNDMNDSDEDGLGEMVFAALKKRPTLPAGLFNAIKESLRLLFGEGQFAEFVALRPTVNAYVAIARGIVSEYGVGLSDFFESYESSETDGTDSKPISPTTTPDSTPEESGDDPEPKDS